MESRDYNPYNIERGSSEYDVARWGNFYDGIFDFGDYIQRTFSKNYIKKDSSTSESFRPIETN